jgi:hypothetical protein
MDWSGIVDSGDQPSSDHQPDRPSWKCRRCGADWPCGPRRTELATEFAGAATSLSLYLASYMVDAARELPELSTAQLYARFILWMRPPRRPQ